MNNINHWLEIYFTKLYFNLKSETKKTHLSYLWWVIEPALQVLTFFIVFGVFLNRGTNDFLIFLLCGNIPFVWFSRTVSNASNSIVAGKGLIGQIAIPKILFPLWVVGQDFVKQSIVFVCLFVFFLVYGLQISIVWLYLVPLIVVQLIFIIACAVLFSAITPFLPDFKFLLTTALNLLMFASGIFYNYKEVILAKHQEFFLLNPMANLINSYRDIIMHNQVPDFSILVNILITSIFIIGVMHTYYLRTNSLYARLVIQ